MPKTSNRAQVRVTNDQAAEIARDLRFLAKALDREAKRIGRGNRADLAALVTAGWTIAKAHDAGLLDRLVNFQEVLRENVRAGLIEAAPMPLVTQGPRGGAILSRGDGESIDESVQRGRPGARRRQGGQRSICMPRTFVPAPQIPPVGRLDGNSAATGLIVDLWVYLSRTYRDRLPPRLADQLLREGDGEASSIARGNGLHRAAWVCRFLADAVVPGASAPAPAPSEVAAGKPLRGMVRMEELRRHHGLNSQERDRLRKRLEYYRERGGPVKEKEETFVMANGEESARTRYRYPAAFAARCVHEIRNRR